MKIRLLSREPHSRLPVRGLSTSLLAVAALALPATLHAAATPPITWGAPTTISADTDVSTTGTLLNAYVFGATGVGSVTVNGVTFSPFAITVASGTSGTTTVGNYSLTFNSQAADTNTAEASSAAPFTGLSSSYQTLLSSAAWDANTTLTLGISGLVNGQNYVFEWWSDDSGKTSPANRSTTTASATNTVNLIDNSTNVAGALGQFVTGTFTGNSSGAETITFTSTNVPLINAFELRTVPAPEPGSVALFALGATAVVGWRRRRRS